MADQALASSSDPFGALPMRLIVDIDVDLKWLVDNDVNLKWPV